MANAIKRISVARGYDVTAVHAAVLRRRRRPACLRLVADALGMSRVFVHPLAGVLSAYGMGLADQIAMREAVVELPLDDAGLAAARSACALGDEAAAEVPARAWPQRPCSAAQRVHLRYQGTDTALAVGLRRRRWRSLRALRGRLPAALRLPDAGARW
jgi:5-oxoprolinase (ATP-hydrolysing)